MQEPTIATLPPAYRNGFALALLLAFIYLLIRNTGVYPMVFADEWLYSSSARLHPLGESVLPSYLYLAVFRLTKACGPGFLECARLFNAMFFVAAAPFLFLLARPLCGARVAAVVAVLCLFAPVNSYTAYFMPEAMYFCGFAIFAWVALRHTEWPALRYGVLTGAVLGVLSVVKVHALFLLPALLVFMLYLCWTGPAQGRWWRLLRMAVAAPLTALAVKALLGYVLAGPGGVQLLGSFYGSSTGDARPLSRLLEPAWVNLQGHAMGLVLLLGLPICMVLWQLGSRAGRAQASPALRHLHVFTVLSLGATLGMTVLYTASIADAGPVEVLRLHLRYYSFVFPLLLVVTAVPLARPADPAAGPLWPRLLLAAVFVAGLVYAYGHLLPASYQMSYVDNPELMMLTREKTLFALGALLQAMMLLLWVWRPRLSAKLVVGVLVPVLCLSSEAGIRAVLKLHRSAQAYDRAGLTVRQYLPPEELTQLTVAGSEPGHLRRALFHLDTAGADFMEITPDSKITVDSVPSRRRWLLVVGPHELAPELKPVLRTPEYALLRVNQVQQEMLRADFSSPLRSGLLRMAEGLAAPETWGAWSVGKQIKLEFTEPLPKQTRLILRASAFGPNLEQDFRITVGGQSQNFRLQGTAQERMFEFETDGNTRKVVIEVPQPISPNELGQGNDERKLGAAIASIELGKN